MQFERFVPVEVGKGVPALLDLGPTLFQGDTDPLKVGVELWNGDTAVTVSGTVTARAVAANGTVYSPLSTGKGTNKAWCIVPQNVLAYPGRFEVFLRIADTGSTAVTLHAWGTAVGTGESTPVSPGTPIPNVEDLQAAAQEATEAAEAAEAMLSGVRPETYGAVGDGTTDDTAALQAAFWEAWSTDTPLVLGYGKVYTTTSDLYLYHRITVFGNGATIKATASMTHIIYWSDDINDQSQGITPQGQFPVPPGRARIENLTLDGNSKAQYGLMIGYLKTAEIHNVAVYGFTLTGIHDGSGYEHCLTNISIAGSGAVGTTGLSIADTGDSRYENIVVKNCEYGVKNSGGANVFQQLHVWSAGVACIPTSVMLKTTRDVVCSQCCADTCAVGFEIADDIELTADSTTIIHGGTLWTGTGDPVVFKVTDASRIAKIQSFGMEYLTPTQDYDLFDVDPENQAFDWYGNNGLSIQEMGNLPTRSHAEGFSTEATGNGSHAEGFMTQATGIGSHVEGYGSEASGQYSHAEGGGTLASGTSSHAEGDNTVANHKAQHVFGEYNTPDPSTAAASARGNYVEIVGNGSAGSESNARTLDWSGNEALAGGLTLGKGTANETTITAAQLAALMDVATVAETRSYLGLT